MGKRIRPVQYMQSYIKSAAVRRPPVGAASIILHLSVNLHMPYLTFQFRLTSRMGNTYEGNFVFPLIPTLVRAIMIDRIQS